MAQGTFALFRRTTLLVSQRGIAGFVLLVLSARNAILILFRSAKHSPDCSSSRSHSRGGNPPQTNVFSTGRGGAGNMRQNNLNPYGLELLKENPAP